MPYFGNNPSPLLLNTVAQNGKEMTLDADADTSITADTDDQIDIKIGGADDFQFTANTFTAQSGSTIAAQALTATTITASGVLDITDTTDSSDATGDTGALRTEGGASIAKKLFVGTDLDVDGTANLDAVDIDGNVDIAGTTALKEDVVFHGDNYNVTWDKSDSALEFGDNAKLTFGAGNDLQIYHTPGTGTFIDEADDGSLFIRSSRVTIHKYTGETMINAAADGAVSLYYDDSKKLETVSNGIEIYNGSSGQNPNIFLKDMNSGVVSGDEGGGLYYYTNDSNGTGNNLAIIQKFENSSGGAALAFETGTGGSRSERVRISASGYLHIGGANSSVDNSAYFEDAGNLVIRRGSDSNATMLSFLNGGSLVGRISTSTSATSYHTSSDYRLKENVTYDWDATTRLKQLKPARFNFKVDKDTTVDGFLAHEVSSIVPEAISGTKDGTQDLGTIKDKNGNVVEENVLETKIIKDEGQTWTKTKTEDVYQGIDQSKLVPLLVKTIQELEARITALEEA